MEKSTFLNKTKNVVMRIVHLKYKKYVIALVLGIVIVGFLLMTGSSSSAEAFDSDIFSVRRIKVAPIVCFIGFVSMIYAVLHKPKEEEDAR